MIDGVATAARIHAILGAVDEAAALASFVRSHPQTNAGAVADVHALGMADPADASLEELVLALHD